MAWRSDTQQRESKEQTDGEVVGSECGLLSIDKHRCGKQVQTYWQFCNIFSLNGVIRVENKRKCALVGLCWQQDTGSQRMVCVQETEVDVSRALVT